jgi:signal transduction histidine kinase
MTLPPFVQVGLVAVVWSGAVGLIGLLAVRAWPRRSVRSALVASAVVGVASLVAGVAGAARAMFIAAHDLEVVVQVSLVAGVVALAVALAAGRTVVRDVEAVRRRARQLTEEVPDAVARATVPPQAAAADRDAAQPRQRAVELVELGEIDAELATAADRLARGRQRERSLEAARRELVAWVSHDLRTPLAGVRAMAEALQDGVAPDPARYHRQIIREVDRLTELVDDLFELSRLQSGAFVLDVTPVDLRAVVLDVVLAASPSAHARTVRLAPVASPPEPLTVQGDGRALARAVGNLVENAVRYGPAGGAVSVDLDTRAGLVVVGVQDDCGGIADQDRLRLFEPGWRGSSARTPGPDGGGGLGLAIARGVAQAHAGDVTLADRPGGCRFELSVPLTTSPANR